ASIRFLCFDPSVVIRTSSSKEIDALVGDLAASREATREAALARLIVLGTRAVDRLVRVVASDQTAPARAAALRALEAIADPRAIAAATAAIGDPDIDVACAAIATARAFLRGARGAVILDRLTALALDVEKDEPIRVASM